jgi:glycosyltransferase involved in cell wall biosynthesis
MTVISADLIERVKLAKARRWASPLKYCDRARVAFVVHSFNREANVDQIVSGLRRIDGHELIVCDDGSLDGSREKWTSYLVQANDFLILSNDLHEIRILDRAIRFASADIVCLVQDDDTIPSNTEWLDGALQEFQKHPTLAIVGGFMGFHGFDPDPGKVTCIWGEAPFQFVDHVNIGPYFIRKLHYEALGGWDFAFSRVGEPGICFDNELCLRAWLRGYQVGYRFVPFKGQARQYSLDGGTILFTKELRMGNQWRNHRRIATLYSGHAAHIAELVRQANRSIGIQAVDAVGSTRRSVT